MKNFTRGLGFGGLGFGVWGLYSLIVQSLFLVDGLGLGCVGSFFLLGSRDDILQALFALHSPEKDSLVSLVSYP